MLGLIVLIGFALMALIAPWISPKSGLSAAQSIDNPLWAPPSRDYPLGTDHLGRSVAAQFVWGSRVSLVVGLAATVLTIAIGSVIGITAGFFGGGLDTVLMRITDWFLVIPFLPLAIVLAAVLDRSIWNIIIVIGVTSWPGTARLVRAQVLTVKQRLFVDRARSLGATRRLRRAAPHPAQRRPADPRQRHARRADLDPDRDHARLPRPRRPDPRLVGQDARGGLQRGGDHTACLVVLLAGRDRHRAPSCWPSRCSGGRWRRSSTRASANGGSRRECARTAATCTSPTGPSAATCPRCAASTSTIGPARRSAWPASQGAVSRRSRRRCCACCRSPPKSTGRVILDGEDVYAMKPGRLRAVRWTSAAVVFQGALHSLNPVRRVGDQIEEAIHLHSRDDDGTARRRTDELLERVGIPSGRGRSYPHQLSGGQRQRVLIALALACGPKLLIADEPTTALDVMVQAQVLELLAELQRDNGLALLFITHDLSVLTTTCERLAVMYAGRIVEEGPSDAGVRGAAPPVQRGARPRLPDDRRPELAHEPAAGSPAIRPIRRSCRPGARSTRGASGRSRSAPRSTSGSSPPNRIGRRRASTCELQAAFDDRDRRAAARARRREGDVQHAARCRACRRRRVARHPAAARCWRSSANRGAARRR